MRFVTLLCILFLAACGGGGDKSKFSISTNKVSFTSTENGTTPSPKYVDGRIKGVDRTIYIVVIHSDTGISNVTVQITGEESGRLTIYPRPPSQLSAGTYTDTIEVNVCYDRLCNSKVSGSPKRITVTHTVKPETAIISSPESLAFTAIEGQPGDSQSVSLSSKTDTMPSWSYQIVYLSGSNWLTVDANPETNTLQVSTAPMLAGSYSAILRINYAVNGRSKQLDIPVNYNATSISVVSQQSVAFEAVEAERPDMQTINVGFSTTSPPSWTARILYQTGNNWLDVTKTDTSLSIQPQLLPFGNYNATIRIEYGLGSLGLSSVDIPISYTVNRGVTLSASGINIITVEGVVPSPNPVTINYAGLGNISWSITIGQGGGNNWLTVNPTSGTSLPAGFEVGVRAQPRGRYSTTINVNYSFDGISSSLQLPVTYTVNSGVTLSRSDVNVDVIEGSVPASVPVNINYGASGDMTWSTRINYQNGNNWLTVTPNSGNSLPDSFDISFGLLPKGEYTATINVDYFFSGIASTIALPITYTVNNGVTLSRTDVAINAVEGAAPAAVPVDFNYSGSGNLTWTTNVNYSNGSNWLTITPSTGDALPASFNINAAALPLGQYTATIDINYSFGDTTSTISLPVSYTTTSAWNVQNEINFVLNGSTTSSDLARTVTIGDMYTDANSLSWSASLAVPWATIDPTTGDSDINNQLTITLVNAEVEKLSGGEHTATLQLVANNENVSSINIPISLTMALPVVDYISPYVEYVDTVGSDYKIIRGSNLSQMSNNDVIFGTTPAVDITVVSDTEVHVVPPVLPEGSYVVFVQNSLDIQLTSARLVVKAKPAFADSSIATNIGIVERVIYDEEREMVFGVQCYFCTVGGSGTPATIYRFHYDNGWQMTTFGYPGLFDAAFTPDGSELLVLTSSQLLHVNPVTMSTNKVVNLPFSVGGVSAQMAVMNNGKVLFIDAKRTYSLLDGSFGSFSLFGRTVGIAASPDGSRAVTGDTNNPGTNPLRYYDASTDTWTVTSAGYYYSRGKLDRHAKRLFVSAYLFDENFNFVGQLPQGVSSSSGVISQDGNMVYDYNYSTSQIQVVDISGLPPYVESTPITTPYPGVVRMVINQNDEMLFLVGEDRFVVENLSN